MSRPQSKASRATPSSRRLRCPSCGEREPRLLEAVTASALAAYYRCDECGCLFSVGRERGAEPVVVTGCWPDRAEAPSPRPRPARPHGTAPGGLDEAEVIALEVDAANAVREALEAIDDFARQAITREDALRRFDACLTAADVARTARRTLAEDAASVPLRRTSHG